MCSKDSHNITIKIPLGKSVYDADFNVFNSHGNIVCLSLYMGGIKQREGDTSELFRKYYKKIKKEWFKTYGEIA